MQLEEIKNQAALLIDQFASMPVSLRNKQIKSEGFVENERKAVKIMREDHVKGCWYILLNRLCKNKGFVIVEVQTTKSVFYLNHFEAFYGFCNKNSNVYEG